MLYSSVRPKVYARNEGGRLVYDVAEVSYYLIRDLSLWSWLWWLNVPLQVVSCEILPQVSVLLQGVMGAALHPVPSHLSAKSLAAPSLARTDSRALKSCSFRSGWFSFWQQNGSCMVSSQPALKQVRQDHAKSYEWWTKCSLRLCDGMKSSDVMVKREHWTFTFYLPFFTSATKFSTEQAAYLKSNHLYPFFTLQSGSISYVSSAEPNLSYAQITLLP